MQHDRIRFEQLQPLIICSSHRWETLFKAPFIIALAFAISSAASARFCFEQLIFLQAFQLNLFLGNDSLTFDWEVLSDAVLSPGRWKELKDTPGCRSALLLPFFSWLHNAYRRREAHKVVIEEENIIITAFCLSWLGTVPFFLSHTYLLLFLL